MIYAADLDHKYHVAKYVPDVRGTIRLVAVCDGRSLDGWTIVSEPLNRVCLGCRRALDASSSKEWNALKRFGGASHESAKNGVDDPRGLSPA